MTIAEFLVYLAIGRLFIWLIQITGIFRPVWALHPILEELRACDVCLGFWVYLALAWGLAAPFDWWHPWLEMVLLAGISSALAHFLRLGWQSQYGVEIYE